MDSIIFGISGQDGYYLKQILEQENVSVLGISRSQGEWTQGSISDFSFVENLIKIHKPSYVFHLSALSTTKHHALFENHDTISTGTLNILESVKRWSPDTKVFITGSGVQFKNLGKPIDASDRFEANSAYSVARIQSVMAARYYRTLGIRAYVGYLFHHESPRRSDSHVSKFIANYVRNIGKNENSRLEIGDITVRKEWAYAKDIVAGIFTLINQENVFEASIGTGISYSIEEWLSECFGKIGADWRDHVTLKEDFNPEYKVLLSDPTEINALGWKATTSFATLASIMIEQEQ